MGSHRSNTGNDSKNEECLRFAVHFVRNSSIFVRFCKWNLQWYQCCCISTSVECFTVSGYSEKCQGKQFYVKFFWLLLKFNNFLVKILWILIEIKTNIAIWGKKFQLLKFNYFLVKILWILIEIKTNIAIWRKKFQL